MSDSDDRSGTVEVRLRFWRNRDPSGKGAFRGSGDYLPDGLVWPTGMVEVPKQQHTHQRAERHVNNSFEWMSAIREALEEAGVKMVKPDYRP